MKTALVALCSVLVLSASLLAQAPSVTALPNTVYVGADGKFETAPDTALIQFNISAQADTAKDAYEQAAKQAEATRQVLRANGIDPKAAQIGFFSVNPQYDWKSQKHKIIGYQVTTSVSVKLKDFSKIGPITQQLADASVGESQSLSYILDSTEEAKGKAVADAYRRARASAQVPGERQRTHARRTLVCIGRYVRKHTHLRARDAAWDDGHGRAKLLPRLKNSARRT